MADLVPLAPLGHPDPQIITIGPVTIGEEAGTALASLATRLGQGDAVAQAAAGIGLPLPAPGRAATAAPWGAFWLGPGQWMVEAPLATHPDLAAALRPAFAGIAAITEQTDAWARFDLTGTDPAPMLERLTALDIRQMGPGHASRTLIEHLGCYLIRRADRTSILCPRSAAASLHHALTTAARSAC